VFVEDTRQSLLFRVPSIWHSILGSRQRLTAVSFRTAADDPLPSAFFAECLTLGKHVFAECCPVSSVLRCVKEARYRTLPSVALGKAFFAECPTKGTRQRGRHSAKPRILVNFSQRRASIRHNSSSIWQLLTPACSIAAVVARVRHGAA
jgi:hypothetical protein